MRLWHSQQNWVILCLGTALDDRYGLSRIVSRLGNDLEEQGFVM
jgi:hypothetical protein